MSEKSQLTALVIGGLVLGIIGLLAVTFIPPLFDGNLVVNSYEATLAEDGSLNEHFTYDVGSSGQYRMLYRIWQAPIIFDGSPTQPSVRFVSMIPLEGTIGYAKDDAGKVRFTGGAGAGNSKSSIENLAQSDEVGIFNPNYYTAGKYSVDYTYTLHPPIEYDGVATHLNLKLTGDNHIPYHAIRITVPAKNIVQVYAYPPSLTTQKSGDHYIITGSAAANEIIAVEMVGNAQGFSQINGFRTEVKDIQSRASSASFWYNIPYLLSDLLSWIAKVAVILVPLLLILIYYRYGREKEFTVPAYLSTLPSTALKPWQVNLLFKGDALDFDEDGYYATLLDLHRRKIISITEKVEGKGIEIRVLSAATTDPYELRVLGFVGLVSENGVLDTDSIAELAKSARTISSAEEKALQFQRSLTDVTSRVDTSLSNQYIVDGRDHLVPLLLVTIFLFAITVIFALVAPMQSYILFPAVTLWAIVLVQVVAAIIAPSTLFGHWKGDRYKEKLEWDAFTHFLSDMAMIQKYSPADLSMWGEWLVYGTALGVGDKVERAMKTLRINIPETGVPLGVMGMNAAFVPLMHLSLIHISEPTRPY